MTGSASVANSEKPAPASDEAGGRKARRLGIGRRSPSQQGGEDGHQPEENDSRLSATDWCGFEIQEIEDREALEGASARHRVVAGLIAADTSRALRYVENRADAGAVELIRQFDALQRKPANHVSAEGEREAVRVEPM
jgi:hypothetical protein